MVCVDVPKPTPLTTMSYGTAPLKLTTALSIRTAGGGGGFCAWALAASAARTMVGNTEVLKLFICKFLLQSISGPTPAASAARIRFELAQPYNREPAAKTTI